jgi:GNAT superfamily N-acetyltransferase
LRATAISPAEVAIDVSVSSPGEILPLRDLYRQEMSCQIVHDSWHGRGWTDSYLLRLNGRIVGYGLVGGAGANLKDTVVEFYVLPAHRGAALPLFRQLVAVSRARSIEAQTNDLLLTLMLFDCAGRIQSEKVLFRDAFTTSLALPGATFRRIAATDSVFVHTVEPVGEWVLAVGCEVAATGGILLHYNPPYADIHMEVADAYRRRGYGSYLVQELKRTCYEMGKVPAARCDAQNMASRATLQRAGLLPCACVLTGVLLA